MLSLMMVLMGAGAVAAGYSMNRQRNKVRNRRTYGYDMPAKRHYRKDRFYDEYERGYYDDGYDDYEEEYIDPRPPPISRRNPNDVSLFDTDIEEGGNYANRARMKRYARHKLNNRFGYRSTVWDLEGFIR